MSNFDDLFDKSYAERMREQTDEDFSDQDWGVLAGRLDAAERKRHRVFPMWISGLLGGLLLLSNLIWFLAFDHFKKEVRQSNLAVLSHRDTIYETILEHRTDTIYFQRASPLGENPGKFFTKKQVAKNDFQLEKVSEEAFLAEMNRRASLGLPYFYEKKEVPFQVEVAEKTTPVGPASARIDLKKIDMRPVDPLVLGKNKLTIANRIELETIEKSAEKARFFKNDWWMVNTSGGWLIPLSSDLTRKNGYSIGGQLEYGFRPNQSVWVEFARTSLTCAGDKTDSYGIEIPYKHNYRVAYFETTNGPKVSNRIGMGLRFRQDEGKKWGRLGFGAGYFLEYQNEFDVSLEWQNVFNPTERQYENLKIPKENYAIGYLHADLGIEWRLGRSCIGSLNIWKEAKGNFPHGLPGYFGIKGGLGYRF